MAIFFSGFRVLAKFGMWHPYTQRMAMSIRSRCRRCWVGVPSPWSENR